MPRRAARCGADAGLPLEWLRKLAELNLSPEEKALVESLGGGDKLMETLNRIAALVPPPRVHQTPGSVVDDRGLN